ncbi:MAG: hypothetical protein DCC68_14510 [Planctomycetota bacterium]|nr:MAG: hypothetical protein DCC68_14510 [Planctomycetota bacterium]
MYPAASDNAGVGTGTGRRATRKACEFALRARLLHSESAGLFGNSVAPVAAAINNRLAECGELWKALRDARIVFGARLMIANLARFLFVFGCTLTACEFAGAAPVVVASHLGDVPPSTEGWNRSFDPGVGGVVTEGPILDGPFSNAPAWFIDDDSANDPASGRPGRGNLTYSHALTPAEASQATTQGWKLTADLRIVDAGHKFADRVGTSPFVLFNDGAKDFVLGFRRVNTTTGDLLIQVSEGAIANPDGSASATGRRATVAGDAYHRIELVYDPLAGSADLLVDGAELISDYVGVPLATRGPSVAFGSGETPAFGRAHYHRVSLAIVPEPSASVLSAAAMIVLMVVRRLGVNSLASR